MGQDKVKSVRGQVHIMPERCKGCGFCIQFCPNQVLAESDETNQKGYHFPYVAKPDECIACNLCEAICPDFVISVTADKDKEAASV